jgi:hypothetical protein
MGRSQGIKAFCSASTNSEPWAMSLTRKEWRRRQVARRCQTEPSNPLLKYLCLFGVTGGLIGGTIVLLRPDPEARAQGAELRKARTLAEFNQAVSDMELADYRLRRAWKAANDAGAFEKFSSAGRPPETP